MHIYDNIVFVYTSFASAAFPVIEQAEIIAQEKIAIHPEQPLTYDWKGHEFKVDIPDGAISRTGPVTMFMQASFEGNYQFPDGGVLVSGIYCLSLHPTVEKFNKKVG